MKERLLSVRASLLAGSVFALSFLFLEQGTRVSEEEDRPPFFFDEAHKLAETYYWHLFAEQRDFQNPNWSSDFFARTNPPVAKYLFGAALALGGQPVRDHQLQVDSERLWTRPGELRKRVPDAMLRISRWTSAAFGAAVCMLIFLIGSRIGSWIVGAGTVALFLAHPVVQEQLRIGLTEIVVVFFMTAIAPVTMRAAALLRGYLAAGASERDGAHWIRLALCGAVVPGLVVGLAAGTKLTGGLTGAVYAGGMLLAALSADTETRWTRRLATALVVCSLAALVAFALFIGINPYFYHEPLSRLVGMLRVYTDWTLFVQLPPYGGMFHVQEKIAAVRNFAFRIFETLPPGSLLGKLGTFLTALGFTIGLLHLAARSVAALRVAPDRRAADASVAALWVLVFLGAYTVWLPLNWSRYQLVPYLAACLLTALGLARLPRIAASAWRGFRQRSTPRGATVAAYVLATGIWIVLCVTPWVTRTADPIARFQQEGWFLMSRGRHQEAIPLLERAWERLSAEPDDEPTANARRASALATLALSKEALGDAAGAAAALRQRALVLQALREEMVSNDPYVHSHYDQVIEADAQQIERLLSAGSSYETGAEGNAP